MAFPHSLAIAVILAVLLPGASLIAAEPPRKAGLSQHTRDAILAGFRQYEPKPLASSRSPIFAESASVPAATPSVASAPDPEVLILPAFQVVDKQNAPKWDKKDFTLKTEAIPLVLGTGVTEIKGKHRNILIRQIFFIPIAVKIEW